MVRVAAAADLRYAMDELSRVFERTHTDARLSVTYGSSGTFFAQLQNGAPFDVFLSADVDYPTQLAARGLTLDPPFEYGRGRLVLWVAEGSAVNVEQRGLRALTDPSVARVAMANPAHAPYGRAAQAALREAGLAEAVAPKLVLGENVSQALQFAQTRAADAALVALSLVRAPQAKGRFVELPPASYPPIVQGGVVMRQTSVAAAARAFAAFLITREGNAILARYGLGQDGQ